MSSTTRRGINVRQEFLNSVNDSRREALPPRAGAPPRAPRAVGAIPASRFTRALFRTLPTDDAIGGFDASMQPAAPPTRAARLQAHESGRDPYSMVDEIFDLKKELLAHQTERKILKARLQHAEQEIAALQQQQQQPAAQQAGGGSLVHGLKQQLREAREQTLRREGELAQMAATLQFTRVEELDAQLAAYAGEIARLTVLLDQGSRDPSDASTAVAPRAEALQRLQSENAALHRELREQRAAAEAATLAQARAEKALASVVGPQGVKEQQQHQQHVAAEPDPKLEAALTEAQKENFALTARIRELEGLVTAATAMAVQAQATAAANATLITAAAATTAAIPGTAAAPAKVTITGAVAAAAKVAAAAPTLQQQNVAATTLQSHWRRKLATKRAAYMREHRDQIALALGFLQAALRGHVARARMLEAMEKGTFEPPPALGRETPVSIETSSKTAATVAPAPVAKVVVRSGVVSPKKTPASSIHRSPVKSASTGYSDDEFIEEAVPDGGNDSDDQF